MIRRRLALPLMLLAACAAFGSFGVSAKGADNKSLLTDGLLNPRGIKVGPDGMLYVAEAGTGGTTQFHTEHDDVLTGNTGRISKIDPATGVRTTVVDGLPSYVGNNPADDPSAFGVADLAFLDNTLYYLRTGGTLHFPGLPNGIYRVNKDGTSKLLADVGAFTKANPTLAVKNGQEDVDPEGNPYSMLVRGRSFYVVDGNQNQVIEVTESGKISRLADFPEHEVTTGIASKDGGPLFVSTLGPEKPGKVYQVGFPTGLITQIAGGVPQLTGLAFGPGGGLYADSFAAPADDPNGPPVKIGSGGIFKVNDDGTMSKIVTGFTAGTTFTFIGDTAYILNDSVNAFGTGEVWKVENFSSIAPQPLDSETPPPPPAPPTPDASKKPVGVKPPDTGSGPTGGSGDAMPIFALAIAAATLGVAVIGGGYATRRR